MDYVSHPVGIAREQGAQDCPEKHQPWRRHWPVAHAGQLSSTRPPGGAEAAVDHKDQRNHSPGTSAPPVRRKWGVGAGGCGAEGAVEL